MFESGQFFLIRPQEKDWAIEYNTFWQKYDLPSNLNYILAEIWFTIQPKLLQEHCPTILSNYLTKMTKSGKNGEIFLF